MDRHRHPARLGQNRAMLELEQALQHIVTRIPPPVWETLPIAQAHGRFVGETIVARVDLPGFDSSAMDGYAVRADDVRGARADSPVRLRLAGQVPAGEMFAGGLSPAACIRVFTGSPLPGGTDAVVMQEDTRVDAGAPEEVVFLDSAKPWEHVRLRGEDVKAGAVLVQPGDRLTAGRLGLLAAAGIGTVPVARRPVVSLLGTGDELVDSATPGALRPGQIFESNRTLLAGWIERAGAIARPGGLVPDSLEATRVALEQALAESDAVITTGGVSVGSRDFVKQAFQEVGGATEFWRVAIKPGKPFVFGRCGTKLLFGLPGNPVSAAVTFLLLVRPALWKFQGATDLHSETGSCLLAEPIVNRGDRRHFVRVRLNGKGEARMSGVQASHRLRSLAEADGLVDVPAGKTLAEGSVVPVIRFAD
jgi:molybdopterin molybdotransferase